MALSEAERAIDEWLEKGFQKLWEAPSAEEAQKTWDDWLKEAQKNPALAPPRRELTRLILDRVTQEPKDIEKAGQRLRLIREGNTPYPPEAHFALMFSRDGPTNPPAAEFATTLPLALQVRRLAERTPLADNPKDYSYSERLNPWIGAAWLDVDREREKGQDRLLSGSAAEWQEGLKALKTAEAGYRDLQSDAALVRKTFAVRDRVQALLPFYRSWALQKATPDAEVDKELIDIERDCRLLDENASTLLPAAARPLAEKADLLAKKVGRA